LTGSDFQKSLSKATLYVKKINNDILIISLYVDDLLVTGSTIQQVGELKHKMVQVFEMIDLGLMRFFLGMEIMQNK
jgi:adenine/guanine phosphoribosyltransferase-like PRPP-binding protein